MGINLLTFNQKTVTPKDDALIQQFALGQDGFFYGGVVTYTGGNTLHFASGEGVICGREFVLEDTDVSAALPASGTLLGQVYIHIDLSNADTPIELICETAAELTELTKDENMNVDNGEYDLQLCTFTATTSAITDLSSKVTYIKKGGTGSNDNLATVEEGSTSSQAYVIGQHLVYDDIYCEVIETIAENDAFVVYPNAGANIKPAKVGEEIYSLSQNLTSSLSFDNMTQSQDYQTVQKAVRTKIFTAPTDCWVSIVRHLGAASSQYASDGMNIFVNDETLNPVLRIWSANGQYVQSPYIRLKAGDELYAFHGYSVETRVYAIYTSI